MNIEEYNEDELKNAPLLKSMSRENTFKVPDGYFDSFPTLLSEKIAAQNTQPKWIGVFQRILQPKFVIASVVFFAVIASGVFYFNTNKNTSGQEVLLSYEDVSNSVYMYDLDENTLIDELSKYQDNSKTDIPDEIENYLIDSQTDISLIENEL